MKKNKEVFYWYLVLGLVIIVVVAKFVLDISISKRSQTIPKEYTAASKPISSSFDKQVIEELQKKRIINNIDLESIKTYKELNTSQNESGNKEVVKKNPTPSPVVDIEVSESTASSIPTNITAE